MKKTPYKAPEFNLKDSTGISHTLSQYRGKWVVLYFYPKDNTPGCTIEACSLRDSRDNLTDLGATVIGISRDSASSHDKFKTKYNLNFTLLSDPEDETIRNYGAWGPKQFGREGILRKTFIINPNGEVVKAYGRVTPAGHGEQVVEALKQLQSAA